MSRLNLFGAALLLTLTATPLLTDVAHAASEATSATGLRTIDTTPGAGPQPKPG